MSLSKRRTRRDHFKSYSGRLGRPVPLPVFDPAQNRSLPGRSLLLGVRLAAVGTDNQ